MVQNQGHFETEEPVPAINKTEQTINRLRNNKVPGIDLIPAELAKFAGPEYVSHLHKLIVKIWITEITREEWNLSILCPIHKNGVVMVCSSYRGISLFTAYKIFSIILFNRPFFIVTSEKASNLTQTFPCVEDIIRDYQCGFLQGR
jgi:hypothetical protein